MSNIQHDPILQALIDRVVETADPLRIVLFGSRALGTARPDSDYDLLVVMPEGIVEREIAKELYVAMIGIKAPADFLVVTPEKLERHRNNIGLIYKNVLETGEEIYARAA